MIFILKKISDSVTMTKIIKPTYTYMYNTKSYTYTHGNQKKIRIIKKVNNFFKSQHNIESSPFSFVPVALYNIF